MVRGKTLLALSFILELSTSAWGDETYECPHLDLDGTRLRVAPSVREPFSHFHRPTAGYRFTIKGNGSIDVLHSMPGDQWKSTPYLKVSPIDPISGTATVSDDGGAGLFSFYILETRGPEIAVRAGSGCLNNFALEISGFLPGFLGCRIGGATQGGCSPTGVARPMRGEVHAAAICGR
jgi:hypothetical protein